MNYNVTSVKDGYNETKKTDTSYMKTKNAIIACG